MDENSLDNGLQSAFDWEGVRQRIAQANVALAGPDEIALEMVQQIWARRAARLAEIPVQEDEGEQIELVLVQLGREIYGLEAQYVFDIRPAEHITRVPRVPDWVAGVVNLRGRILSVVDLKRFFGLAHAEHNGDNGPATPYLAVVETPDMELVLLVDEVLAVETLPASQMQDVADTIRGLPSEYVRGVAECRGEDIPTSGDGSMLVVLDLPVLLADKQLIIHEEII